MEWPLLFSFLLTFLFVSLTPGMCMVLSLTLGMRFGFRKSLWMMAGELVGVGLVAALSLAGAASVMLTYPSLFIAFKIIGGGYLGFLAYQLWASKGKLRFDNDDTPSVFKPQSFISQGFITAVANPKGWAFFITLLPPFIDYQSAIAPQASALIAIILVIEFVSLCAYNLGGKTLKKLLKDRGNVQLINRIAGTLMAAVAVWLVLG